MATTITIPDDLAEEFQFSATEGDENARSLCALIDEAERAKGQTVILGDGCKPGHITYSLCTCNALCPIHTRDVSSDDTTKRSVASSRDIGA